MAKPVLSVKTKVKGGKKAKSFFRRARAAQGKGAAGVHAGFFAGVAPESGMPITNIAATNEFGAKRDSGAEIPERPFMRLAGLTMRGDVRREISEGIDPATGQVDRQTAARVGETMKRHIQQSIEAVSDPPNAPITARRKGADDPLTDTGNMKEAVDYEIQ